MTATHRSARTAANLLRSAAVALALVLAPGAVLAQPATPQPPDPQQTTPETASPAGSVPVPSVEQTYAAALAALDRALTSGEPPHPDQATWRASYEAAEVALAQARESGGPAELRRALILAARNYGVIGWHARAFARFDEFFAEGGELPALTGAPAGLPTDVELFVGATNQLAYARYLAGDHAQATGYYLTVLEVAPDDPEALRWLARISFERGDAEGARVAAQLWERLLAVTPDDQTARYYLERSRQRVEVGVAASDSFHAGISAYEAGDLESALNEFQTALTANANFVEADVWSGRVALELGLPDLAARHWRQVLDARPEDGGAAYFLAVAETQVEYGVTAGRRFYDGMAAYQAGDLAGAAEAFIAATNANPDFVEAWVWAARSLQEGGDAGESVPYWERVLELTPEDERAAWFLRRARLATERGDVAGPAFFDALAAYEAGDADAARQLLELAVEAEPDFVEAWGYLGRIAFQQERFADAAQAYTRAAELDPSVDEYSFFAEEARRLSGDSAEADDDGQLTGEPDDEGDPNEPLEPLEPVEPGGAGD